MFQDIKDLQVLLGYPENVVSQDQQATREEEEIQEDLVLKAHLENKAKEVYKESVVQLDLLASLAMQEILDLQVPRESQELQE